MERRSEEQQHGLFTSLPASLLLGAAELLLHTVFISENYSRLPPRLEAWQLAMIPAHLSLPTTGMMKMMKLDFPPKTQKLIV